MNAATGEQKRRALGRGLESLLPSRPTGAIDKEPNGRPLEIPVDQIDRNPFQTRADFNAEKLVELAQSIAATGVVQPISVQVLASGRYQLINGERRLLASKQAGKLTIPAIVCTVSDEQAMEMTIVENLQRADLNPMEQARAYQRLSAEFKMTQEQMATRTGKDRASVANFLRLLRLPAGVQQKVEAGELSFGHARTLLGTGYTGADDVRRSSEDRCAFTVGAADGDLCSRPDEPREAKPSKLEKIAAAQDAQDPNVQEAQDAGCSARSVCGFASRTSAGRGRVIIDYANIEDFDASLTALNAVSRLPEPHERGHR